MDSIRTFMKGMGVFMAITILAQGSLPAAEPGALRAPALKWTDRIEKTGLAADHVQAAWQALDRLDKEGKVPGSVAVIGRNTWAIRPKATGFAVLEPEKIPMKPDTIFDLASITKVVATNTSIMILMDEGKIRLDDPVTKYLPEFGDKGKDRITIRQLLTHTGGLPAFKRFYTDIKGKEAFYMALCQTELAEEPGAKRIYSDLGFMTLGLIVEKVSGLDLNSFTQQRIFKPLGMKHTRFNPPTDWKRRTAATEIWPIWKKLAWGEVHDENANAMGGAAGHAGLFSTAEDLAVFCQMLLNGGQYRDSRILKPETIRLFHSLQTPDISDMQAMGWILCTDDDPDSDYLGKGSFGHGGFTGTFIRISPRHNAFAILLTNAIHTDREKANKSLIQKSFFPKVRKAMEQAFTPEEDLFRIFPGDDFWVEKTLAGMSLEEKAGQLIFPQYRRKEEVGLEIIRTVKPGGVIVWPEPAPKAAEIMNHFQMESEIPLLITADFERGVGCYVDGATDLPGNMALGAACSVQTAAEAAKITARESRAMGVHLTFAPVVDVNNNPDNPIINIRSFGADPEQVARLGTAWIRSAQKNGLLATVKHYPGHGNTATDSHTSLGKVPGNIEEIRQTELVPFKDAIKKGRVSSVMTAHLWVPAVDASPLPATLSRGVMTNILRKELGFEGILFTDAMVMGAITKQFSMDEAIIRAVEAGCDAILMPADAMEARQTLIGAVQSGRLSEERLDQSVRRILSAKTLVNLHRTRLVNAARVPALAGTPENEDRAKALARKTLTLVQKAPGTLPFSKGKTTGVILIADTKSASMIWRDTYTFGDDVKRICPGTEAITVGEQPTGAEMERALDIAKRCDQLVVALYPRIVIHRGNVSLTTEQADLLKAIHQERLPDAVISFGSPYVVSEMPALTTFICAYGNARAVQSAAAEALFSGEKGEFPGKSPVPLSGSR